ncbi:MAG: SGNH/GDSL hydrolase family protein [Nanobdellota archaeon]
MRYLLFGASITAGETDYEKGGWANHLRKVLDTKEKHRYCHNLAISGNTTRDLLRRIKQESKERIKDKSKEEWTIFLSIGTNDSRIENNEANVPKEEYKENVERLLSISKELAGRVIVVGAPPVIEKVCNPFKGRLYFYNKRIREYADMMRECAEKEDIEYIEIFSGLKARNDLEELYDDGLHPNKKGHELIFNIIRKELDL